MASRDLSLLVPELKAKAEALVQSVPFEVLIIVLYDPLKSKPNSGDKADQRR